MTEAAPGWFRLVQEIDQSPCDGCDACGARCVAGVPMRRAEYLGIRSFLAGPEGAAARAVEQTAHDAPYPGVDGLTYAACRFRDHSRGRCSIYPVRPFVCRLFGYVEWLPCPIEKTPRAHPGGVPAMLDYAGEPLASYETWLERNEPAAAVPG